MVASPPEILLVSKPLAPPWNDSGKNLPRVVAEAGERFRYRVLLPRGATPPGPRCVGEEIYGDLAGGGGFAPSAGSKLRVLLRLFRRRGEALRHFFFAPNPMTSRAAALAARLGRVPTVQTVSSRPRDPAALGGLLFADRIVALSRATEAALREAGVDGRRIARIAPGVPIPAAPAGDEERRAGRRRYGLPETGAVVLFPGDLEFSSAAETFAGAAERLAGAAGAAAGAGATFVLACRRKTAAAEGAASALRARLAPLGPRVRFAGEVPDMPALLAASDVVALPADDLYAKMDLPLVLLEALAAGRPVIVADAAPIREVVEHGGGVAIPARDPAALARALAELLASPERRRLLGEEGARAARAELSAAACARRHEDLYRDLLAEQSARSGK